jgi:hypothetical protein
MGRRNRLRFASLIILLIGVLSFASAALADVAPPAQPPGSNIGPGETTRVQMLAETVDVTVRPLAYTGEPHLVDQTASARVKASFTLKNLGSAVERMQVRFPLMDPSGMGDGFGKYPEIQDIQVRVNEKPVTIKRITTPTPNTWDNNAPPIAWAAFDVTFPPGKNVAVDVSYSLKPTGYYPVAELKYILETGAGWSGPIGSADIILHLPYDANPQNVLLGETVSTTGGQLAGGDVRWHYQNLEPTAQDNWVVNIVTPGLWQAVLDARAAAQIAPDDAKAWISLAHTTGQAALDQSGKGWLREDSGGKQLANESAKAYAKAVLLKPDDAVLHVSYADLLWREILQYQFPTANNQPGPGDPALQRCVEEVNAALKLDPKNEQAQSLRDWMQGTYPSIFVVNGEGQLGLATTVPSPQPAPSSTPEQALPSATLPPESPTSTITPLPKATSKPASSTPVLVSSTPAGLATTEASPTPPVSLPTPAALVGLGVVAVALVVSLGVVLLIIWWFSRRQA